MERFNRNSRKKAIVPDAHPGIQDDLVESEMTLGSTTGALSHCLVTRKSLIFPAMKPTVLLIALAVFYAAGCQSARYVYRDNTTGVIAIPANNEKHRVRAAELMLEHFPAGYAVLDEGEYVTGQRTTVNSDTFSPGDCDDHGLSFTNTTATTRDTKEWRIRYRAE